MHKDFYKYPNGNYVIFLHKDIPTSVSRAVHYNYNLSLSKNKTKLKYNSI